MLMVRWSQVRALYQIYPRSFFDTNSDGIGDLPGITRKFDYLSGTADSLGVDAIWITPFYPSPMADFGYDVSNYENVDPLFGTLADFDALIDEAHSRDLKVMIDFVPNHSSDQHEWFERSRSSRHDAYRDWYVWRDPAPGGGPPNNWLSVFGGSAWEYDDKTGQYYLHTFLAKQPDLNWENPAVRRRMCEVLKFWLERGVDGFRVDAVRWISKDPEFRDNPENPSYQSGDDPYHMQLQTNSRFGERLFDYLKQMSDVVEAYDDAIMIFEDYPDKGTQHIAQYLEFYRDIDPHVAAPINYDGISTVYDAKRLRDSISEFQVALRSGYRPVYSFGNHDKSRLVSRVGHDQARLMAVLELTLPGLPVLYYGEELGMTDGVVPPEKVQDPFEKQVPGRGLGRDPQRTPMQWTSDPGAGFSDVEPWLPVASSFHESNVAHELHDEDSFLSLYRRLLHLRGISSALARGTYDAIDDTDRRVFAYVREHEDERLTVILNVSGQEVQYNLSKSALLFLSTHTNRKLGRHEAGIVTLRPHEALVIR